MANTSRSVLFHVIIATCFALTTGVAGAQGARPVDPASAAVFEHWTPERRAAAIPRDLVVDPRGYGYLRLRDGTLVPHGHDVAAQATGGTGPRAAPIGDTTGPTISGMDPSANATIGSTYTFKATVTDASGVKSVTFKVQKSGGTVQSFSATKSAQRCLVGGTAGVHRRRLGLAGGSQGQRGQRREHLDDGMGRLHGRHRRRKRRHWYRHQRRVDRRGRRPGRRGTAVL